jgi:hypothetical protein
MKRFRIEIMSPHATIAESCEDGHWVQYDEAQAIIDEAVELMEDVVAFIGWGAHVPDKVAKVDDFIAKHGRGK